MSRNSGETNVIPFLSTQLKLCYFSQRTGKRAFLGGFYNATWLKNDLSNSPEEDEMASAPNQHAKDIKDYGMIIEALIENSIAPDELKTVSRIWVAADTLFIFAFEV